MTDNHKKINAATRLRRIAERASTIKVESADPTFRRAWTRIFEIEPEVGEGALLELIERLLELRKLFEEVIDNVHSLDLEENMFITPILGMRDSITNLAVLDQPWHHHNGHFNPENLRSLMYIEREISKHGQFDEKAAKDEEIQAILATIDQAVEQITKSSLSKQSKQLLLDILLKLRNGLFNYRIRGAKALRDALGSVLGMVAVNQTAIEEAGKTEEGSTVQKIFSAVHKLYQFADKNRALLEAGYIAVKGYLVSGDGGDNPPTQ